VLIQRLSLAVEAAKAAAAAVELDARERRDCESQLERLGPALEENREHRAAVQRFLERAAPGATGSADAYEQVCERARQWDYLRTRQAELAADPRWYRWREDPRVTGESAPADADWHPEVAASRTARLEELSAAIEAARGRLGELENKLRDDPGSRAALARDAVQALEEELAETRRRRDRLALLDSIVCRSEQIFRDEHQPDVLRRASHYLERVTDGRYHRLDYIEGEPGGLHVSGGERAEATPVGHPISRGTLDQIFLCLRLGLLDHLDERREKLPLLLDDALLRMDDARRQNLYRLLAGIAPTRQIFFLTCHANIAAEAEAALKAIRIDLANHQENP
jgi:uncharacterized protein YhaN